MADEREQTGHGARREADDAHELVGRAGDDVVDDDVVELGFRGHLDPRGREAALTLLGPLGAAADEPALELVPARRREEDEPGVGHGLAYLACALEVDLEEDGLPRRPWFRHQVYAPGYYTGYGVKTLPAVREALEQRAWDEARQQIPLLAQTLERYAGEIERAAAALQQ